jgi:hypothetical protein
MEVVAPDGLFLVADAPDIMLQTSIAYPRQHPPS